MCVFDTLGAVDILFRELSAREVVYGERVARIVTLIAAALNVRVNADLAQWLRIPSLFL